MKGNLEMRTMFGRNMALVLTKVNGYHYVNLYNNNPRNPGRCSLGWDEFIEMIAMRNVLEQLHSQFEDPQQQPKEQMFTPPTPPPPFIATPIVTPGGKRQHDTVGDEPQPKRQIVSTEGIFNPLEFFQQLQQFEGK
ncbi:Hypothetical predicted protein [Mytilus galloprovincialis]|uniref:Uncharacterized protein n=1 Tax=Mytilus galloprovincialis TaxID=29158 RepID=A0A8B6HCM3_MYTGA|nr:Hypothetical predicted protein [Mytilus galloprovincialis]